MNGIKELNHMSLREFICYFSLELEDYYDSDFFDNVSQEEEEEGAGEEGDTLIICLVDTGPLRKTSRNTSKSLRKAGQQRRRKIKHRYSYDNPMNRIHGFLIAEEVNNSLIPSHSKLISLSLICSSVFSDKKGIGSELMNNFLDQSNNKGYTDVILEVANEWSGVDIESEEESEESEESEEESEESEYPSEEVIDIITHEFWRKTMRKPIDDRPYYNVAKEYIRHYVSNYLHRCRGDIIDLEPQYVSDDPLATEYGGFWYKKGRSSQLGLIKFYEKFGFKEEPEIHLGWHCYGNIPYPSMICSL